MARLVVENAHQKVICVVISWDSACVQIHIPFRFINEHDREGPCEC